MEDIERKLAIGVNRVIIGTKAVSDKEFVKTDEEVLKERKCEIIKSRLITTEDGTVKHDTLKLSSIIFSYLFR